METYETICSLDELTDGEGRTFVLQGRPVGIFRIGQRVHALEDRCPHAGASLARGCIEGDVVRCRIHHWGFRLSDGVYVDEDKPACNARAIPTRVVNGWVQVSVQAAP